LVPSWSHDLAAGVKAINARADTVADKPGIAPGPGPRL